MQLVDLSRPSSGDRHRPRKSRAKAGAKRGRPKGGKNLLTLEREYQARLSAMATGAEVAETWLTEAMQVAGRMMRRYCPVTQDGEASKSKHADVEKFYRACNLLTQCAVPLLPFQSPKLAAVAIQAGPPPIEVSEDRKR